ncbi:hypothetical protein T210_0107915 [Burkholderia pseudomallei MSHR6137]|nr:hypothetical protein T210_0107915 [Burkholderia pseudomallei MSHR6137]
MCRYRRLNAPVAPVAHIARIDRANRGRRATRGVTGCVSIDVGHDAAPGRAAPAERPSSVERAAAPISARTQAIRPRASRRPGGRCMPRLRARASAIPPAPPRAIRRAARRRPTPAAPQRAPPRGRARKGVR